jgi:predicted negative regulator of RcsB-dependent stress response
MKRTLVIAIVVLLLGIGRAVSVEWAVLDEASLRARIIGGFAFVLAAVVSSGAISRIDERSFSWVLAAAAMAVLLHGQIEMTFHYAGSVVWAMCTLGVASNGLGGGIRFRAVMGPVMIAAVVVAAIWLGLFGWLVASTNDARLSNAARVLREVAQSNQHEAMCERRTRVAQGLRFGMFQKADHRLPLAAAQQFVLAAEQCSPELRSDLLVQAVETLEDAMARSDRQSLIVAAIGAHVRLAAVTGKEAQWNRAIELAMEITRRDPHGISSWRNLGDVLWAEGRGKEAAVAYEQTLQNDANFELDELKQLSNRDRQMIHARIEQSQASSQELNSP